MRAILSAAALSVGAAAWAQTPGGTATTLPPLTVETKKKAPAKKTTQAKGPTAPAPAAAKAPPPQAQPPRETATGPVQGYVAKRTATGTKTDTPLKEVPQSISVVGAEQMRDQGAQALQDTVRYTAGVIADQYGLDSRSDGIGIRGTEAAQFLDGLRRTNSYYVTTIPIEPYALERVEILRGPASVLYGQASVGGIVNMVTKRPQEEQYREVTVEYGTHDYKQVKTDMTGKLTEDGKWLYRIVGLARDADTQVDYVENDRYLLAPSLTYRPSADTSITFLGDFRRDHSGSIQQFLPWEGTLFPNEKTGKRVPRSRFTGEPDWDRYDTDQASATLLFDHRFDDVWSIHHAMRYTDTSNVYATHYPGIQSPSAPFLDPEHQKMARVKYYDETDTRVFNSDTNIEAKFNLGPTRHKILGGYNYMRYSESSREGSGVANVFPLGQPPFDIYNPVYGQPNPTLLDPNTLLPYPEPGLPITPEADVVHTQHGLYIQDQIRWGPWIAVLGLRQDWLVADNSFLPDKQEDEALTGRAGLMYELPFGLTPYVSYSESFVPVLGSKLEGGGYTKPLEGEQIEVGIKYQPLGYNFMINAAVFDITEKNRSAPGGIPNTIKQIGEARMRGFEIEGIGQLTPNIKVIANYSYVDARESAGPNEGLHIASVPDHLASFWAIYTFNEGPLNGWSVGGGVRYVGKSWDGGRADDTPYGEIITPSFTLFDAMIAYDTPKWRWSLNARNLTDEYHLTTCLARGDCFVGEGRTIMTAFTYRF